MILSSQKGLPGGIFGLREDLQQLVIGEEEEAGEEEAFLLQIVVQTLQDQLQEPIGFLQFLQHHVYGHHCEHMFVLTPANMSDTRAHTHIVAARVTKMCNK